MTEALKRIRNYEEENNSIARNNVKFNDNLKFDEEYDLVIVGGGGTGLAAAVEAGQHGITTLVLEKAEEFGGTTSKSGGVLMAADTKPQKELTDDKDDSVELYFEQMLLAGEGRVDEELVKDLCYTGKENVQWLDDLGVQWDSLYGMTQIPYIDEKYYADRIHVYDSGGGPGGGRYLVDILYDHVEDFGIEVRVNSPVVQLIQEKESREVIGVVVEKDGKDSFIKAKKGVLIATASIDNNPALAKKYHPQQYFNIQNSNVAPVKSNTGDGIIMGIAAGGAVHMGGTIDFCSKTFNGTNNKQPTGPVIFVDGSGKRFVAEDSTYSYQYRAIWQASLKHDKPTYMIFTENSLKDGKPWDEESLKKDIENGVVIEALSIRELAEKIDLDADVLEKTLEEWNSFAEKGKDPVYGRIQGIEPIKGDRYYAYQNKATNLGSLGGLKINVKGQVVDQDEEAIEGLYAAGLASGGWAGDYYPGSGYDISAVIHFARRAVDHIASR